MNEWDTLVRIALPIATWFLGAHTARQKERRDARNENIKALQDILDQIASKSMSFHVAREFSSELQGEIIVRVEQFRRAANRPGLLGPAVASQLNRRLNKAVTSQNFDLSIFRTQDPQSAVLRSINQEISSISRELDSSKPPS